jgi:uncharacterized protein
MSETLEDAVRAVGGAPADLPFWEACKQGRFLLHRCGLCGRSYWPASRCVEHSDRDMGWVESAGVGELYTYTVMHRAYSRALAAKAPYVVGVIKLEEGPFFHSNVVGVPIAEIKIGMLLKAEMTDHETGIMLPVFRPAAP